MVHLEKNICEAELALVEKPLFATSVERVLILDEIKSEYKELSHPRRFAKFLSILLSRVSVPLEEYDLIAGRCVDRELSPSEEEIFQNLINHPDYPHKTSILSSGHCTYSWQMVVEDGLPGMRARALASLETQTDEEKREFLRSIVEIYDAIEMYMLRYADAAEKKDMATLAANLRKAATERPDTFLSALQLLWIITFIDCAYLTHNPTLTVGRLDQILYPLYKADIERGHLTKEEAAAYITDYYCKHNLIMGRGEHQVGDKTNSTTWDRICNFDAPQYLLLAGTDEHGTPAVNELTYLFAECINPKFKNPVIVVRYFGGMNEQYPDLWKILMKKSLASASMMFYNDDNMLKTWARMGLPEEDYRNYVHFGCNWPSIGDNGAWMLGGPSSFKYNTFLSDAERESLCRPYMRTIGKHGWPECFVLILKELVERPESEISIEDIYEAFFTRMSSFIDEKLEHLLREMTARKRRPASLLTFGDCFFQNSLTKAECFSAGAKYHYEIQAFQMFGTVADCFIVVDRLVFIEKKLTLKRLLEAVEANFVGYEDVLALCRSVDKYGSDTPHSNAHAKRLAHTAADLVIEKNKPYLEKYGLFLTPCMQSDTWHLKYGEDYGATPDGRLANTPFSQNTRPSNGAATNGLTAMLNSMLSIPSDGVLSGALNLDVDPRQFSGETGEALFGAILGTYFNQGGLHAQISSAKVEDLIDAQKNPHLHRDLRVRVTGYSGVYVDICKRLQDDIIERFK